MQVAKQTYHCNSSRAQQNTIRQAHIYFGYFVHCGLTPNIVPSHFRPDRMQDLTELVSVSHSSAACFFHSLQLSGEQKTTKQKEKGLHII